MDNSLQIYQPKELQERMDDMSNIQIQISEEVTLEQANMSQQFVEEQNQNNAVLQNVDLHEKKLAELLENCKGIEV